MADKKKKKKPSFPGLDELGDLQKRKGNRDVTEFSGLDELEELQQKGDPPKGDALRNEPEDDKVESREDRLARRAQREREIAERRDAGRKRREDRKAERDQDQEAEPPPEPPQGPTPSERFAAANADDDGLSPSERFAEAGELPTTPSERFEAAGEQLTPPANPIVEPPKTELPKQEGGQPHTLTGYPRIKFDALPEGTGGAEYDTYEVLGWLDTAGNGNGSSQSSKSTAIVPAPWLGEDGFVALFIAEMPEVRFDDVITTDVHGRSFSVGIDSRFVAVCEPGSIAVCGWSGDLPGNVGFEVDSDMIHVRTSLLPWRRPKKLCIRLTGIRKGFADLRFPTRTREQFDANEAFINSAYPAAEAVDIGVETAED